MSVIWNQDKRPVCDDSDCRMHLKRDDKNTLTAQLFGLLPCWTTTFLTQTS